MIVKNMTAGEVIKELRKIDEYVLGRMNGLNIKNAKKLKNKFVKDHEIMSISNYTIPETNDAVVVYAIKKIQTIKGKDYATMWVEYYVKTCYDTYIISSIDSNRKTVELYVEYSRHSVDRMKMRLGKDFDSFFREDFIKKNNGILHPVEYNYNGDENERVAHAGDAFLIMEEEELGKKYVVKTTLSTSDLYCCQLQQKLDSKIEGEQSFMDMNEEIDRETAANFKIYKKIGAIRATG